MRYLCLLVGEPGREGPAPGTPEFTQMLSDYASATQAMATAGVLVDSGPLQPPVSATTIRVRDGESLAVARNQALDQLRRESRRSRKEEAAMRMLSERDPPRPAGAIVDDDIDAALIQWLRSAYANAG